MDLSSKGSTDLLKTLYHQYKSCTKCDLHKVRPKIITGSGDPEANVFVIIDKLTRESVKTAKPVTGSEEELLEVVFGGVGLKKVWISPTVLCSDFDGKEPKVSELRACRERLGKEIHYIQPRIILALGGNSAKTMFPKNAPAILTNAGKIFEAQIEGDLIEYSVPVMISYSPSYLLRNPDNSPGGLWNKFYNHIRSIHLIAEDLTALEDSKYVKPTSRYGAQDRDEN